MARQSAWHRANRDRRDRSLRRCVARTPHRRQSSAKMLMQSRLRQAGTTPVDESRPGVGLIPTILLNAAGTRPEPAVSVPSEKAAMPGRHGDGRTRAGAARDVAGVEHRSRRAVGRARAVQPGGELVEIGLADQDRAGCLQPRHHRGIGFAASVRRRGRRRWSAGRRHRYCPSPRTARPTAAARSAKAHGRADR